jgi:tRNA(Ile2) C34 agmatinyltransferase TiaS
MQVKDHKNQSRTKDGANLVLNNRIMYLMETFIKKIRQSAIRAEDPGYVFLTWDGNRLPSNGVSNALTKILVPDDKSNRQTTNNIRKMMVTLVSMSQYIDSNH